MRIALDIGTSFCPKAVILHFSTRSTPYITAQPFQHLIRSWVVQIKADSLWLLLVAGNFCRRQDRIVRDFARSAVIFIWVSNLFNIVDIHSLAANLQLNLSFENSEKPYSEFSRTANYSVELQLMIPSMTLSFSDEPSDRLRLSSERTLRVGQDYQSTERIDMPTEAQSGQSSRWAYRG